MSIDRSQSSRAADRCSAASRRNRSRSKNCEATESGASRSLPRADGAGSEGKDGGAVRCRKTCADSRRADARAADAGLANTKPADDAARASVLSEVVEDKAQRRADDLGLSASSLPPADASALLQAQMALRDGAAPTQAPPPAANPQAFVDLIERHVRQLAVGDAVARDGDGQVLLRMADATLPGTDLLLTRNGDGWTLRADVRSRSSFDAIREAAPELAKRFAERNLGTLEIDPHFHG